MARRFSERSAAALLAAALLDGCMMVPMGGAMVGMSDRGAEPAAHGGHEDGDWRQGMHGNMGAMRAMCESMMGGGAKR